MAERELRRRLRRMKHYTPGKDDELPLIKWGEDYQYVPEVQGAWLPEVEVVSKAPKRKVHYIHNQDEGRTERMPGSGPSLDVEQKVLQQVGRPSQEYTRDVLEMMPVAGDAIQAYDAYQQARAGNWLMAGALAGGLFLPNVLEKGGKALRKFYNTAPLRFANPKYQPQSLPRTETPIWEFYSRKPSENIMDDFVDFDETKYKYLAEGGESKVYDLGDYVLKSRFGLDQANDFDKLRKNIKEDLLINRLPGVVPIEYIGFKHTRPTPIFGDPVDVFTPLYIQRKVTPATKTINFDGTPLSRKDFKDEWQRLGYVEKNPDLYNAPGVEYSVGDLRPDNVGYDDFGNLRIFDPMVHVEEEVLNKIPYRPYNSGKDSGIHIKPSKRGTFTAAAKRRGMTVKQLTSAVLRQPGKYSKAMRKKAQFARNASKWKK